MTTASLSTTAAADSRIDPRHPFATHLRQVAAVEAADPHRAWTPDDGAELSHSRTRAPGVRDAHPTVEHVTPLFVTLGASADPTAAVHAAIDGFVMGLAERSFEIS